MRTFRTTRGFTLIELLVTMGLIVVLLSLAIAVSNSATLDSYKINGAGDRLSQALLTAKSRAARDKAPRGIRLIPTPDLSGNTYYRELLYIEQPEPWLPDQSFTFSGSAPNIPHRSQIAVKYLQRPAAAGDISFPKPNPAECSVYLILTTNDKVRLDTMFVSGQIHIASSPDMTAAFAFSSVTNATLEYGTVANGLSVYVLGVTNIISPDLAAGHTLTGPSTENRASLQTPQFGIYLPAKPLAGEPTMILSKNAAVDPAVCLPAVTDGQAIDILFAPAGHVMFRSEGIVAFLLRDTSKNATTLPAGQNVLTNAANYRGAGEMVLVALYPKTGTVVTKPVLEPDSTGTLDPYKFAKDAINSGL